MICFAVCVGGDGAKFRAVAEPALNAIREPEDQVWTRQGATGIAEAYNEFIDRARALPDCEALVLMHDDVELLDPRFHQVVRDALAEPEVGVIGAIGGRGLWDGSWWESRSWAGQADYTGEVVGNFERRSGDVDTVDGFLMILSREALERLRCDGDTFPDWHGYDVDLCLQARRQHLRVLVRPLRVYHRSKGTLGDQEAFYRAKRRLVEKYPDLIRSRKPDEWGADTLERARRVLRRRLAGAGRAAPLPPGQQVSRRSGTASPRVDPWRARALWLHEYADDASTVWDPSENDAFAAAAASEAITLVRPHPDRIEADLDLVTLWHLEQSADPAALVTRAAARLRPGGRVLLESIGGPDAEMIAGWCTAAGLRMERTVTMTRAAYLDREDYLDLRRQALEQRTGWPVRDVVRVVAGKEPE